MGTFFHTTEDGTKLRAELLSLDAYEADGGQYDDGADEPGTREEFVAALVVSEKDGDDWSPCDDVLRAARDLGVAKGDLWRDASSGWYLLRDWPAEATHEARMLG